MKRVITLLAVMLGALCLGAVAASAAGAHGGDGVLEVEAAHPTGTGVHYIVRLTYQNDGDAVSGATVTATPISPSGDSLEPVTLAPAADGTYQAPVDMPDPGEWRVRFASDEPPATLEQTAEISETPTTEEDGSSEGFAPADDGTGGSAAADDDSGSDSVPILLIVAAAVVAIGGTVTALRIVLRNRPTSPSAGAAPPADPRPTPGADDPAPAEAAPGEATAAEDPGSGTSAPTDSTATPSGPADDAAPTGEGHTSGGTGTTEAAPGQATAPEDLAAGTSGPTDSAASSHGPGDRAEDS